MTNASHADAHSGDPVELADLLERLHDLTARGDAIAVDALISQNPRYATQLRDFATTLERLNAFANRTSIQTSAASCDRQDTRFDSATIGDYRIVRKLGNGGMGNVFEAEQISLRRRVALKILSPVGSLDVRKKLRFRNEAQAAASLHHPNIVAVFHVGCEEGVFFYAMQLIDGISLDQLENFDSNDSSGNDFAWIAAGRKEPTAHFFERIANLGMQAAEALDHAHQHGIVHRDVKPANLLLDRNDNLWVTDFGLARVAGDIGLTLTGELLGTLRYMSPEQVRGAARIVDHRTDIYSLGATLYELLSGEPAIVGSERGEILLNVLDKQPRPLHRLLPTIPEDLQTIVHKCLAKQPEERYQSADELRDDLCRFIEHRPIYAHRASIWQKSKQFARRYPSFVMTAGVSMAIVAIVATLSTILVARARAHATAALHQVKVNVVESETEQRISRELRYVSDIEVAHQMLLQGDLAGIRSVLGVYVPNQENPEDLRGFEWYYLWEQALKTPLDLPGHKGQVYCTDFSPDSLRLAAGGNDGFIRVWNVESRQLQIEFQAHLPDVNVVQFSADARRLLSCGGDGTAKVWDTLTWQEVATLTGHKDEVRQASFVPSLGTIVTGGKDGTVRVWDDQKFECLRSFSPYLGYSLSGLVCSSDGRTAFVACDDFPVLGVDTTTGEHVFRGHGAYGGIKCLTISPDGSVLVAQHVGLGGLTSWKISSNGQTGDRPASVNRNDVDETGDCIEFLPSRSSFLSAGHGKVRILEDAKSQRGFRLHSIIRLLEGALWRAQLSPSGRWMAVSSRTGRFVLWPAALECSHCETLALEDNQIAEKVSAKLGGWVANKDLIDKRALMYVDLGGPKLNNPDTYCVSKDGKSIALGDLYGKLRFLDLSSPTSIAERECNFNSAIRAIVLNSDGSQMAVATDKPSVEILNTKTLTTVRQLHGGKLTNVLSLSFSVDNRTLAIGSQDQSISLWHVSTGRQLLNFSPLSQIDNRYVEFSHDGKRLFSIGAAESPLPGQLLVWEIE